jgi:6-pyruvoyltetrahydropterin/6-carboxytetrahydropterin synthase
MITATRYHDISCGHRVVGHENKCRWLHGHNYRVHFTCEAEQLDAVGRVIDFSVMKSKLCMWLEDNFDHKFLAWNKDDLMRSICGHTDLWQTMEGKVTEETQIMRHSMVWLLFNPTAENIAKYLLEVVGPAQLEGTGVHLVKVVVEETRKCSASATL